MCKACAERVTVAERHRHDEFTGTEHDRVTPVVPESGKPVDEDDERTSPLTLHFASQSLRPAGGRGDTRKLYGDIWAITREGSSMDRYTRCVVL